ncbi:hypothetical protein M011DRAFT_475978 [Sporormia fimetaria CBS 119925]|uniref:Uncharacterized protein n=1 Tax=Sporormia fimetaria CBS 119925 TaxID=1340428 RepID=A0A6A6VF76_9PLEO|nr:hypothetical protein M011DRAFT_475978 [Sporormia fimetaria CBS 119925]
MSAYWGVVYQAQYLDFEFRVVRDHQPVTEIQMAIAVLALAERDLLRPSYAVAEEGEYLLNELISWIFLFNDFLDCSASFGMRQDRVRGNRVCGQVVSNAELPIFPVVFPVVQKPHRSAWTCGGRVRKPRDLMRRPGSKSVRRLVALLHVCVSKQKATCEKLLSP